MNVGQRIAAMVLINSTLAAAHPTVLDPRQCEDTLRSIAAIALRVTRVLTLSLLDCTHVIQLSNFVRFRTYLHIIFDSESFEDTTRI